MLWCNVFTYDLSIYKGYLEKDVRVTIIKENVYNKNI